MKVKCFLAVILMSIFTCSLGYASDDVVEDKICKSNQWLKGWQGFKEAHSLRKENSCKTLVYFRADFCAPCKILKKKLFDKSEFYTGSSDVTKVKVEFPGSWHERRLAEKFGLMGAPGIYVMHNKNNGKSETTEIRFQTLDDSKKGFKVATVDEALELINGTDLNLNSKGDDELFAE